MLTTLVILASLFQGALMFVDEYVYHHKRGLPRWEMWGHPLDSIFFLLPLAVAALASPTSGWVTTYFLLAVFSALFVTKDEWVHAEECEAGEHFLHALLFLVHPCVLIGVAALWMRGEVLLFRQILPPAIFFFTILQVWRYRPRPSVDNSFYETLGSRWFEDDAHAIALLRVESKQKIRYVREILSERNIAPAARILDIGCGAGFVSAPLSQEGYDVKGVDLSANSIETAQRFDPKGKYEAQNAYALREADETYDVVLMLDFLEHVEEPERALAEAKRVLKPQGLLIFHTFNRTPVSHLLAVHGIRFVTKDCPSHVHVYHLFLKPRELERHGERLGLAIGGWRGIRPVIFTRAFFWSLFHRRVHPDFSFTFTPSLSVGYLGYFIRAGEPPR